MSREMDIYDKKAAEWMGKREKTLPTRETRDRMRKASEPKVKPKKKQDGD